MFVFRSGHCAILKTDAIYLVGGEKLGDELTVDVYNITVGKWGPTLMVEGRQTIRDHACVLYQGKIIVTGAAIRPKTSRLLKKLAALHLMGLKSSPPSAGSFCAESF